MSTALAPSLLGAWLRDEIAAAPEGGVVVLAGHFAIFTSGAMAGDLLDDGGTPPQAAAEMLAFTKSTWSAACEAVALEGTRRARLLVLVDDIQFVRPVLDDRAAGERLGAALASNYLDRVRCLPEFHTRALRERALGDECIVRRDERRWLFSERELRAAAVTHLREQLHAQGAANCGLTANADESRIDVTLPEFGEYCLVHSGNTNCAGGYLELLWEVHRRGARTFIALVPMRCLGPVTVGTSLAGRIFGHGGLSVLTVAIPDAMSGANAAVTRSVF
jgi:hypothetical protein